MVPGFILKKIIHVVALVISRLISVYISSGVFPALLKNARVIPLFKSGKRDSPSNYRPISILTFLSKLFEKVFLCSIVLISK